MGLGFLCGNWAFGIDTSSWAVMVILLYVPDSLDPGMSHLRRMVLSVFE